jgi:hypothetical protein
MIRPFLCLLAGFGFAGTQAIVDNGLCSLSLLARPSPTTGALEKINILPVQPLALTSRAIFPNLPVASSPRGLCSFYVWH